MNNCRILVDVDCSRYEDDAFSLLDKSAEVNVVKDLKSSTVATFDQTSFPHLSTSSRTQLKQQLLREQLKNCDRSLSPMTSPSVFSVQLPLENMDIDLPKKVLQVETRLENPTRYHVIQKQKTQVREYVTAALKLTKQNVLREATHSRLLILAKLYDSFIGSKPASGTTPNRPTTPSATVTGTAAVGATLEQQQEWRLEMKLAARFGNKLYQTFIDEFDYIRDLLCQIRFEIPKWVFVVTEFEGEISSFQSAKAAAGVEELLLKQSLSNEKNSKHEKFIEPEVRDRIKKDNHNCSMYRWVGQLLALSYTCYNVCWIVMQLEPKIREMHIEMISFMVYCYCFL
ncbi:transcription factor E3-like [Wyeomyia smithii]|uniref:transcription factor E3-like n=1 Tax=Wyeomyia smithii TaxID=174621 RepID=UPI002467CEA2|nr:transcription factor E3-like [Wyeomyia smithii]